MSSVVSVIYMFMGVRGGAVVEALRYKNRKVAGSIPDDVRIFH
jgi:hypothetical protein